MPVLAGNALMNFVQASRPPAEAPIATIGNSRELSNAPRGSDLIPLKSAFFFLREARMSMLLGNANLFQRPPPLATRCSISQYHDTSKSVALTSSQ